MSVKTDVAEPATYLSLQKAREQGMQFKTEDIEQEITYADVEELLSAKSSLDLTGMAERYAFFSASQQNEFSYDFDESKAANRRRMLDDTLVSAAGYYDMKQHMETAIRLKELLGRKMITPEDLAEVGIGIEASPESDMEASRALRRYVGKAKGSLQIMASPQLSECSELCDRLTLPLFSLRLRVSYKDTPYSKHLMDGMLAVRKREGYAFAVEYSEIGFSFDILYDHFKESPSGYRQAVAQALDTLISVNLADAAIVAEGGLVTQKHFSAYSAFWYCLSRRWEGGRAARCEACDKPFIVFGERGMKRRYCNDACRKWAQRNPGKKRGSAN